jgi:FkbM family methyltransferase
MVHNLHSALEAWQTVEIHHLAVWRANENPGYMRLVEPAGVDCNTGGRFVTTDNLGMETVGVVGIDEVLQRTATRSSTNGCPNRVGLLKMDCEGAEWDLLRTSQCLDLVDEVVGEYHLVPRQEEERGSVENLMTYLHRAGFQTRTKLSSTYLGLFWAWRG